jgi:DNA-binding response OmpR family regulator
MRARLLKTVAYDLLILDLMLPDIGVSAASSRSRSTSMNSSSSHASVHRVSRIASP